MMQNELTHYGVKGMRWGVRRYQNADGSLTAAGRRRYNKMSDNELRKTLYKQVKKARSEQSDWSNQWNVNNTIGKNSKAVQDRYNKDIKEHHNSDQMKEAKKKWDDLNKRYDQGKIDMDDYEMEWEAIRKSAYKPELDGSVRITETGREYSNAYLNTYGKDLNIAYLKDLGYNEEIAKEFTERILKANKKILNGM